MDHVPLPRNPVHSPVKIPLFCTDKYEATSFLDYLGQGGMTSAYVVSLSKSADSLDTLNALLQYWGYFGIMSEIFGRPMIINDFTTICAEDGEKCVTTSLLPSFVDEWIRSSQCLNDHEMLHKLDQMEECVSEIQRILMEIYVESGDVVNKRLLLSMAVLIEHLDAAKLLVFRRNDREELGQELISRLKPTAGIIQGMEFVAERMLSDGWCPREVWTISKHASCAHLYDISNLERPGQDKDHSLLGCTSKICRAYQIKRNEYRRRQATTDCSCPDVHASQQELLGILSEEGTPIPVIVPSGLQQQDPNQKTVQLVSTNIESEYIAISHVWSDGLGNEHENAIPRCQFERLCNLVTELCGGCPKPFWLDTLCFPLGPPDAYKLAMVRMRSTYEDAYKVLVLNNYLLSQAQTRLDENEIVTRIRCSPWSRRLWTLQEGALASSLAFQFSDTWVDLSRFTRKRYERLEVPGHEFFSSSWDYIYELRAIEWDIDGEGLTQKSKSTRTTGLYNIHGAKQALGFRSTSVQEDEALCLSALLEIDTEKVLSGTTDEKMKTIWANLLSLPQSVIFWTDPKLKIPGYRWASSTFLNGSPPSSPAYSPHVPWAELTDKGVMVTYPGILLSGAQRPLQKSFQFQNESGSCFQVVCLEDQSGKWIEANVDTIDPWPPNAAPGSKLAIIAPKILDAAYEPIAILVLVEDIDDVAIRVRWLYSAAIVRVEGTEEEDVIKHVNNDRKSGALAQVSSSEAWDRTTEWTEAAERKAKGTKELDPGVKSLVDTYHHLASMPHDELEFLCSCQAQWIMRGQTTKPDQVWCVD
ncbi:MAG: hypothetical protein Q9174_003158 [Haloplaca sp. 1 TL-2023]